MKPATTTPPAVPAGAPARAAKGFGAKVKANPQLAVGAGAVAVVILLALVSAKKGTTVPDPTASGIASRQAGGFDSTANDLYGSFAAMMADLQTQISDLGVTASDPTPAPNDPTPTAADTTVPAALIPAPAPAPAAPQNVIYQGADGVINHVAAAVQSTPYANGQLLYTDPARPWLGTIQTADTAANRAEVARSGGSVVGGY